MDDDRPLSDWTTVELWEDLLACRAKFEAAQLEAEASYVRVAEILCVVRRILLEQGAVVVGHDGVTRLEGEPVSR